MTETVTAARLDAAFADAGVTGWLARRGHRLGGPGRSRG
ncbi:hypothetical protein STENM327S_04084 [Streptomyces tendae]